MLTAEWVTALAAVGTLVVVAASSLAALRQLRHMHDANQLAVLNDLRTYLQSDDARASLLLVTEFPARAEDPAFRHQVLDQTSAEYVHLRNVLNFFDQLGAIVKHRMVERDLVCDLTSPIVTRTWDSLSPFISTVRAQHGLRFWEDFEYLVIECRRFRQRFPHGTFPKHFAPLALPPPWDREDVNPHGAGAAR